ncbi:44681_t:CDS:2, partial [Gigaspora margarita]
DLLLISTSPDTERGLLPIPISDTECDLLPIPIPDTECDLLPIPIHSTERDLLPIPIHGTERDLLLIPIPETEKCFGHISSSSYEKVDGEWKYALKNHPHLTKIVEKLHQTSLPPPPPYSDEKSPASTSSTNETDITTAQGSFEYVTIKTHGYYRSLFSEFIRLQEFSEDEGLEPYQYPSGIITGVDKRNRLEIDVIHKELENVRYPKKDFLTNVAQKNARISREGLKKEFSVKAPRFKQFASYLPNETWKKINISQAHWGDRK